MMRRTIVGLATIGLLVAGCGGRDEGESGTETTASNGQAAVTTTTVAGGVAAVPGQFGTIEEPVCGPGDPSGSPDQGVTDSSINIGALTDAGNTIQPGLFQEFVDASEAFVAFCNAAGGINGRQINLTIRDTKIVEAGQRIAEACAEDFMLVGGGNALDGTTVDARLECGLPQIPAAVIDAAAADAGLQVQSILHLPDYTDVSLYRMMADELGEATQHYGIITVDLAGAGRPNDVRLTEALEAAGYNVVYSGTIPSPPATIDNWRPYIEAMQAAGVQAFEVSSLPETLVPLMNSLGDVGFEPTAILGNGAQYSSALLGGNDALATVPMYVQSFQVPFELADQNPPMAQFLELMDAEISGWSEDPKAFAVQSWSAWMLWAQAATACGNDLTRECVLETAGSVGTWDGGGITAPQAITTGQEPVGPLCGAVLRATSDGFEYAEDITQPTDGFFNCDEEHYVEVPR